MKTSVLFVIALILIIVMGYYGWKLERYINYSLSYENQVKKQTQPFEERILKLEQRVDNLEKK